jgi:hypothetical protein
MHPSRHEQLGRARDAHDAHLTGAARQRALAQVRAELASLGLDLALIELRRALSVKYRPDQPRVPAGNGHESGRFADGGGSGSGRVRVAQGDRLQGYAVDLREEEARGGHTIKDHVAKSPDRLLDRVREEQLAATRKRDLGTGLAVGSFPSLESATRLVNSTLAQNQILVDQVARGTLPVKKADAEFDSATGYEAYAPTERSQPYMRETFGVSVVIGHDPRSEKRFRVISALPINKRR